jgi:hypothetical protein
VDQRYVREHYDCVAPGSQFSGELAMVESPVDLSVPGTPGDVHPSMNDPSSPQIGEDAPYKYDPSSPYWGHLDQGTLAMMGIMTPQGMAAAQTPSRNPRRSPLGVADDDKRHAAGHVNAQPLLLRQHQYASYSAPYYNREGYVVPSPATQFMMSPQSNFGYGYGAYGGFSPSRANASSDEVDSPMVGISVSLGDPSNPKADGLDEKKDGNE